MYTEQTSAAGAVLEPESSLTHQSLSPAPCHYLIADDEFTASRWGRVCAGPSLGADEETVHESSWQSPTAHSLTRSSWKLLGCFVVLK